MNLPNLPGTADVFGRLIPGTSPSELRDNIDENVPEDVDTGTPPVAGPVGVPAINVGRAGQFAATGLSFFAQNTGTGREWVGRGFETVTDFEPGFDPVAPEPNADPNDGSPWPWWAPIAVLVLLIVAVNAFAGGVAEGVTE